MITCPNCQKEEPSGALFCSGCGAQLIFPSADDRSTILQKNGAQPSAGSTTATTPLYGVAPDETFALYLIEEKIFLTTTEEEKLTIGRKSPDQAVSPDIDLSAYDAYEKGVSRLHARITREDNTFGTYHILDLNSSNGTRINGARIPINSAVPIHNNDILTLGKLKIQVVISQQ